MPAVLVPVDEGFDFVSLQAMVSFKSVIANGKGGFLEAVIPLNPVTLGERTIFPVGVFFYEQTRADLICHSGVWKTKERISARWY